MAVERVFYRVGADHWPLATFWLFSILYRLAPFITALLLLVGLIALLIGQLQGRATWRKRGIFLIACVVLGPGLIINAVFKDHWDRPRPRDVMEFGGTLHYTPAPWRGEGGSSFPCGHCSVGFLYASGWWLWKSRRPRWARASLALGLTLGSALGLGRMAAGAHFLSDVIWSALLALGFAHVLYFHILRLAIPEPANRGPSSPPIWLPGAQKSTLLAVLGAALVLTALFITPHGKLFTARIDLTQLPLSPQTFEITARAADINLIIEDFPPTQILADGELHGFGMPGSRLDTHTEFHPNPVPTLIYRIEEQGWITDLSASARIRVPPGALKRIVVELQRGSIRVTDKTRDRLVQRGQLKLDLHTQSGQVQISTESNF